MNIINAFSENVILPLSDLATGYRISKDLKFLLASQWWTKEKMNEYQNIQLQKLCNYCYTNVQYYYELFCDLHLKPKNIETIDDLRDFPILTKDIIKKNIANGKLISKLAKKRDMIKSGSSGSTGEPLQFYISNKSYSMNIACNLRGWSWMGYSLGDKYIKISQNPRKGILKKTQDILNNCMYIFSQQLTISDIRRIVQTICKIRKKIYLRGYPSTLSILAEYIKDSNIIVNNIISINTTGEILFPHLRILIESSFNCKVFDSYSCEGGATFFECKEHDHYHIASEYAITELLTDDNNLIDKEGRGEIVTTDLHNYIVPFIKYNTKDIATIKTIDCKYGIGLPTATKIDGRDVDIIKTPHGKKIVVHYFTGYFEWIDSVEKFQIIQNQLNEITLKLVPNDRMTEDKLKKITKEVTQHIGDGVHVYTILVNEIPLNKKNGKRRFVISNL